MDNPIESLPYARQRTDRLSVPRERKERGALRREIKAFVFERDLSWAFHRWIKSYGESLDGSCTARQGRLLGHLCVYRYNWPHSDCERHCGVLIASTRDAE